MTSPGVAAYDLTAGTWANLGNGLGNVQTGVNGVPDAADAKALLQLSAAGLFVGGAFNQSAHRPTSGFGLWTGTAGQ